MLKDLKITFKTLDNRRGSFIFGTSVLYIKDKDKDYKALEKDPKRILELKEMLTNIIQELLGEEIAK